MNFIELMHRRFATKKFIADKKIDNQTIEQIIEFGRLSPSSMGLSPWHFVVIDDRDLMMEIGDAAWGFKGQSDNASHLVMIYARKGFATAPKSKYVENLLETVYDYTDEMFENRYKLMESFQNEDFEMEGDVGRLEWNRHQCYIAAANMMTGAASLDVDSCPIEGFNKKKMRELASKYKFIDLEEFDLALMCAFGYRDQEITPKHRLPLESVVTYVKK